MRFKEFLQLDEAGTTTGDIAGFSRITLPLVRRIWPTEVEDLYPAQYKTERKKRSYRVPQVDESVRTDPA